MNEKYLQILIWMLEAGMFIFVGTAMLLNVGDKLAGTNTAYWFNIAGWCLVPIVFVGGLLFLRNELKSAKKDTVEEK